MKETTIPFNAEFYEKHGKINTPINLLKAENEALKADYQAAIDSGLEQHSKIEALKAEKASFAEKADKRLESLKKHIARSQKAQNEREDVIKGLFSLYTTVLLENNWNDRIEWKNQILEEIQYLIRYIG